MLEINMIVKDSKKAYLVYEEVFAVNLIEDNDFSKGVNEIIFLLDSVRFHLLDENLKYRLIQETPKSIWINLEVNDVEKVYQKAIEKGFCIVQPLHYSEDFKITNTVLRDPFGYNWMLTEKHEVISHKDRVEILKKQGFK